VDQDVSRDHDLVVVGGHDDRLVTHGVARGGEHGDAGVELDRTVHLVQQPSTTKRFHRVRPERRVAAHRRHLGGLNDVPRVAENRTAGAVDHPAAMVLVEVGEHDGVDVPDTDARLVQRLDQPAG
jgi:hypothetical protein